MLWLRRWELNEYAQPNYCYCNWNTKKVVKVGHLFLVIPHVLIHISLSPTNAGAATIRKLEKKPVQLLCLFTKTFSSVL